MRKQLLLFLALFISLLAFSQVEQKPLSDYVVSHTTDKNGKEITGIKVPGIPPKDYRAPIAVPTRSAVILNNVPAFSWSFGCSATSAAMIAGYYDNNGFPGMYTGPTNGGVMPMNNSSWGSVTINGEVRDQCPLSATRMDVDGRTTRGHVDDYWVVYGSTANDPYITNGWTQHTYGDCTGDYMGTNQSALGSSDGSTLFYYYDDGTALYDYTVCEPANVDGCHGLRDFYTSRGYTVTQNYTQQIYGLNGNTTGFTFAQYKQEIDAGFPVLIQVNGHTMVGYGYDDTGNTVYIHDTWDYNNHSMTWGGSYSGLPQWGVTVVRLQPVLNTIPISQARTLPIGDTVTVQGILTADRIVMRYTGYMQDATAGIAIYDVAANHLMDSLKPGDIFVVSGVLKNYSSLLEISPVTAVTILSRNNPIPAPVVITLPQISDTYESMLVKYENVHFDAALQGTVFSGGTTGKNYNVTDANGIVTQIRILPATNIVGKIIPAGNVNVTGCLSQYSSNPATGYQLILRSISDIQTLPTVIADYETGTSPFVMNCMSNGNLCGDPNTLAVVDNPFPSGINTSSKVVRFIRASDGDPWAGFFASLNDSLNITNKKYIYVKVYKPRLSPVYFKLEGGPAGILEVASKYPQTEINGWQDMVFDFSSKTGKYSTIVFMPDFANPVNLNQNIEIYFDDILLSDDSLPAGGISQTFDVPFTIVDNTQTYQNIKIKGLMTQWNTMPMYDDGTNGDATAGDHIWTAILPVLPGTYDWGAIEDDGSQWGIWLLPPGQNQVFTLDSAGNISGQTSYTIPGNATEYPVEFTVTDEGKTETGLKLQVSFDNWANMPMLETPAGSGIWKTTITISVGDTNQWTVINGVGEYLMVTHGLPGNNPEFVVNPDGSVTGQTQLILPPVDGLSLTFNVDLTDLINAGGFDPNTDFVDIAGSFNGWQGSSAMTPLSGNIYTISTGAWYQPGQEVEFKFRKNFNWNTCETPDDGAGYLNRHYTVVEGANVYNCVWGDNFYHNIGYVPVNDTIHTTVGTYFNQIGLPGSIEVTLGTPDSLLNNVYLNVTWDSTSYNPEVAGIYPVMGTLSLVKDGITYYNGYDMMARMMVVVETLPMHFVFEGGNPADPVWTIYLSGASVNGTNLQPMDEIAVFDGTTMVGACRLTEPLTPETALDHFISVFKTLTNGPGYVPGHTYTLKCWLANEQTEMQFSNVTLSNPWGDAYMGTTFPEGDGEYSIADISFYNAVTHSYNLNTGYQFISSYITPPNADMTVVLADLLNSNLSFVRSSTGNMLRKLGPSWVNNIGNWVITEGYLVKMNAPDDFSITGTPVDPLTPINLNTGYQFISYFHDYPMNASAAFAGIMNDNLSFIRNSGGNMLRKLGPNWVNNIGNVVPGEGYLVKMNAPATLIYPAGTKSESTKNNVAIQHFNFEGGNAADPVYTVYISDATINGYTLQAGDEIGVYDGEILVGALALTQTPNAENQFENAIPVFATLNSGEGFTANHPVTYKIWSASQGMEYDGVNVTLSNPYGDAYTGNVFPNSDGVYSIASLTATLTGINSLDRTEVAVYPNPNNGQFTLQLFNNYAQEYTLSVLNSIGIVVFQKQHLLMDKGNNILTFNLNNLAEGVYTLSVQGDKNVINQRLVIKK